MGPYGRQPKSVTNKYLMQNLVGPLHHTKTASKKKVTDGNLERQRNFQKNERKKKRKKSN